MTCFDKKNEKKNKQTMMSVVYRLQPKRKVKENPQNKTMKHHKEEPTAVTQTTLKNKQNTSRTNTTSPSRWYFSKIDSDQSILLGNHLNFKPINLIFFL